MNNAWNPTPGPWEPACIPNNLDLVSEFGRMLEGGEKQVYFVAAPQHPKFNDDGVTVVAITGNQRAGLDNARLIAAAPDLLKALSFAKSVIQCGEPWTDTCEQVIQGAINKAKGLG